jgi:Uma2 family endonuclease
MVTREKVTLEQFTEFVYLPENASRVFELINGEIVEKMPGRATNSAISATLIGLAFSFCKQHQLPCVITGEHGTYSVLGHPLAPDFAYRTQPLTGAYPEPEPPLWVAEVISPTDEPGRIAAKRQIYLQAGILYFEVYPDDQAVDVYAPGQPPRRHVVEDVIDLGSLIPGFTLGVQDIFAQ